MLLIEVICEDKKVIKLLSNYRYFQIGRRTLPWLCFIIVTEFFCSKWYTQNIFADIVYASLSHTDFEPHQLYNVFLKRKIFFKCFLPSQVAKSRIIFDLFFQNFLYKTFSLKLVKS